MLPAFADAQLALDLKALQEQHNKALATAVEPVNRRYKESLEQLLRSAIQRNDLDIAVKIKEEIAKLGFEAADNGAMFIPNFTDKLLKQSWTWTSHPGGRDRVDFTRDGKVIHNGWKDAKWVAKRPNVVIITMGAMTATLRFNEEMTKFEGLDFGGKNPVKGEHF